MGNEPHQSSILYVDDQPSHLALFRKAFQGNYPVLTAPSAEEGIEIIKKNDIFLVIADHNMPRMTGVDFLEKAEAIAPRAVRAILSAYTNDEIVREAARRVTIAGHLKKPWKLDRMRGFIEEAYKSYIGRQEPVPVPPWEVPGQVSSRQMSDLAIRLEATVDRRGARRIFLNFVRPPLREYVPLIRRAAPELLSRAQQEALRGNIETVQAILVEYFRHMADHPSGETPKGVIH